MDLKEKILQLIQSPDYQKMTINEIEKKIKVPLDSFTDFVKIINELEENGLIYMTSKGYIHDAERLNIYQGKIIALKKYFAICELVNGEKIHIENIHLKNAYLNDLVRVHLLKQDEGEVMDILRRNMWEFPALFKNRQFVCEEPYFPYELKVKKDSSFHLVEGHIVLLHIDQYENFTLRCHVKKILGHKNDPGMDVLEEIINANVPYEFSDHLLRETDQLILEKERELPFECQKRLDLSKELIVTIDGKDAKDLDDAISLKVLENGHYQLGVHIADVSHFVTAQSMLDKEAYRRGTSIYLADRVIPMLPHALSNGICSLNQGMIRLCLSCIMEVSFDGEVIDYEIVPSFICSSGRLNYEDVNRLFANQKTEYDYPLAMKQMLFEMQKLSSILSAKMLKRGYLELAVDEAILVMDEQKNKVKSIQKRVQGKAEKMIENFMILANETVASHVFYMQLPFLYRIHAEPSQEKKAGLIASLEQLKIPMELKKQKINAAVLQKILLTVKNTDQEDVVSNLMLRSLSKACYSVNNIGHFGLGSTCYTHFTSPIRRYPDLIVHRLLKEYGLYHHYEQDLDFLLLAAENSSLTERRAVALERDIEDMKKAEYMSSYIGCIYVGTITGIMDFGLFVALENTCEGLMRFETIPDFYQYEKAYFDHQFKVGQKVMVKVISCHVKKGEINFAYVKKTPYNKRGDRQHEKTGDKQ